MDNDLLRHIGTYVVAAATLAIEEVVKHPIGTSVSIVGLLYAYDRWRTQRVIRRIKLEELKKLEDERRVRTIEERTEGTKD